MVGLNWSSEFSRVVLSMYTCVDPSWSTSLKISPLVLLWKRVMMCLQGERRKVCWDEPLLDEQVRLVQKLEMAQSHALCEMFESCTFMYWAIPCIAAHMGGGADTTKRINGRRKLQSQELHLQDRWICPAESLCEGEVDPVMSHSPA